MSTSLSVVPIRSSHKRMSLLNRLQFFAERLLSPVQWTALDRVFNRKEVITTADLRKRSKRGIGRRIVSYYPDETWAGGFTVYEQTKPETSSPFETVVAELIDKFNLVETFTRLDKIAGIGPYAGLLLGISGKQPLSTEIEEGSTLIFTRPLAADQIEVDTLVKDSSSERFGLSEMYRIQIENPAEFRSLKNPFKSSWESVHWSRIIHYCHNPVESDLVGNPDLEAVWDYLDDIDKISGSSAAIYFKQARTIYETEIKDGYELTDEDIDEIEEDVQKLSHGLSDHIIAEGFVTKAISSSINTPKGSIEAPIDLMMATLGIPKRKFFGSEVGELASTEDHRTNRDNVSARQIKQAEKLVRDFINRLITYNIIPKPLSGNYIVGFAPEAELDLTKKVELAERLTKANQNQALANNQILITPNEIRDIVLDIDPLPSDQPSAISTDP